MWDLLQSIHQQKRPVTRFNAYSTLLNIQKQPDESLPALTTRVEEAMHDIQNLRHDKFTLDELDSDLQSMAMVLLDSEHSKGSEDKPNGSE